MTAITLYDQRQGHSAFQAVWQTIKPILADGKRMVLKVEPERKSRDQEKKYHAQIADIARQLPLSGRMWSEEDAKRILVSAFREDTKNDPDLAEHWREFAQWQLVPGIRGEFVVVGLQTRKFPKPLASAFITWLDAFAAENGIEFTDAMRGRFLPP